MNKKQRLKSLIYTKQIAYKQAEVFDEIIDRLLGEFPPSEHPEYWLTLSRTVKTGFDIVETIAIETLRLEQRME